MADHYDTAYMADRYEQAVRRHRRPPGRGRGRRQPLGHGRPDARRADLPGAEQGGQAGLRRLAGPPDRRGVPRRLPGRPPPVASGWSRGRCSCGCRTASAHDLSRTRVQGRLRPRHGRPQQRPRPRRLPDLAGHRAGSRCGWPTRPTWPTRPGTPRRRPGTSGRRAAAAAAAGAARTAAPCPRWPRTSHLHGEVRPPYDPRSTLYNTDGQIFSDAGVPVVLFMENYDINRTGYHDTHDTMANIDLDYGAARGGHRHRVRGPGGDGRDGGGVRTHKPDAQGKDCPSLARHENLPPGAISRETITRRRIVY